MALLVAGVNPRRSVFYPLRERFAGEPARCSALGVVVSHRDFSEGLMLAKGGRIELYAVVREGCDALAAAVEVLSDLTVSPDLASAIYFAEGEDAAAHLFAALCGLDEFGSYEPSEEMAEAVGRAMAEARRAGSLGSGLESLFSIATRLCSSLSIEGQTIPVPLLAGTAVELARRVFGHLDRCCVFLSRAAELPLAIGEAFADAGVGGFLLPEGGDVPVYAEGASNTADDIRAIVGIADIVVLEDGRAHAAFAQLKVREVARLRRGRPTLLLDCGPGEGLVDRRMSSIDGVFLYNASDLAAIAKDVFAGAESHVELSEKLIDQAMRSFRNQAPFSLL